VKTLLVDDRRAGTHNRIVAPPGLFGKFDTVRGTYRHCTKLSNDEKRVLSAADFGPSLSFVVKRGGTRPVTPRTSVAESGLYKLTMRSDKPEARVFQDRLNRPGWSHAFAQFRSHGCNRPLPQDSDFYQFFRGGLDWWS
jgi:hypothetical protein